MRPYIQYVESRNNGADKGNSLIANWNKQSQSVLYLPPLGEGMLPIANRQKDMAFSKDESVTIVFGRQELDDALET